MSPSDSARGGSELDRRAIDDLVERFFAAFTNANGAVPRVESIFELFIPAGVITKAIEGAEVYSLRSFVEPRAQLLTSGALTEFSEEEISGRTDVIGNIAQRLSTYRKSGVLSGKPFEAKGAKVFQFVRTSAGWRISAVAWDDEREGFRVPATLDRSEP